MMVVEVLGHSHGQLSLDCASVEIALVFVVPRIGRALSPPPLPLNDLLYLHVCLTK